MRYRLLTGALLAYAILFPVLAFDTVVRLLSRGTGGEGALLLLYEVTRGLVGVGAVALAVRLLRQGGRREGTRTLVVFLLLGVLAYGAAFRSGGYVGPLQEWLSRSLLNLGVPQWHLELAFAFSGWALWLLLAPLHQFAQAFPAPLTAAEVEAAGHSDRRGLLRGVAGAGFDVGAAMREVLADALRRGWLEPHVLWTVAVFGAALSITLRGHGAGLALWIAYALFAGVAVTALRARYVSATGALRARLYRAGQASQAGVVVLAFAAAAGLLGRETVAFFLVIVAPATLLVSTAALAATAAE